MYVWDNERVNYKIFYTLAVIGLCAFMSTNVSATSGFLVGSSVKLCASDGKHYGYHGAPQHWHEAERRGERWYAVGEDLGSSNPCPTMQAAPSNPSNSSNSSQGEGSGNSSSSSNSSSSGSNTTRPDNSQQNGDSNNDISHDDSVSSDDSNDDASEPSSAEESTETGTEDEQAASSDAGATVVGLAVLGGAGFGVYKLIEKSKKK